MDKMKKILIIWIGLIVAIIGASIVEYSFFDNTFLRFGIEVFIIGILLMMIPFMFLFFSKHYIEE